MNSSQDKIISQLTVRLRNVKTENTIGTGVIYFSEQIKEQIYIITAAHCLFEDGDKFQSPINSVLIDIYQADNDKYFTIRIDSLNYNLVSRNVDEDVAVIPINEADIKHQIENLPQVRAVKYRRSYSKFVIKGFPNATEGKELDSVQPIWKQKMTEVEKFQLQLDADYTLYFIEGFSGSGVFFCDEEEVYLYGIFSRFREEEKGKVIYCQYLEVANKLLKKNYLPLIQFDYIGDNNITHQFFDQHVNKAIKNLGQRYSETLNLSLPIAKIFNDLVRDDDFEHRIYRVFDKWIKELKTQKGNVVSELDEILDDNAQLKEEVISWLQNQPFSIPKIIDIDWIITKINSIHEKINRKSSDLYEKQREAIAARDEKVIEDEYISHRRDPFEDEIARLRRMKSTNYEFERNIQTETTLALANSPILLLKGDAGSGKSHLLGDIANSRLQRGLPTILLLGQHFKSSSTVEDNIKNLLGVNLTFSSVLKSLNEIGEQLGQRIPILIDALNEGAGVDLWRDEIAGLIETVSNYPFIGLTLSIRTTYYDLLVPTSLDKRVTVREHEGFKGNEYAALKLFCEHHGLQQPEFPILTPEFTKPLFLILLCQGVANSPDKKFPQGFQGIAKIFQFYILGLEQKFKLWRPEYRLASNLIEQAIKKFSLFVFSHEQFVLPLQKAVDFFANEFPRYPSLLDDLIQESIFIRNRRILDYEKYEPEDVIYFAYEKFGDYFIARELLLPLKSKIEVMKTFAKNTRFGKIVDANLWRFQGILEALAILLPEMHGLEIFEVYDWLFDSSKDEYEINNRSEWISRFLLDSLTWRTIESIDEKKIIDWLKEDRRIVNHDEYLMKLTELAVIKNHPFNANRLHRILSDHTMPKRDSFWIWHTRFHSGYDDNEVAYPLRRLIDWAWSDGISFRVEQETVILVAQTLTWVLASTHRKLRDETTKALVNLLEQQPDALIAILIKFRDVDDKYIIERLYAIAYGCILRTKEDKAVQQIGLFVYQEIFAQDNPPEHILLRDYARNTVEYLLHKFPNSEVEADKIRPPYHSTLPIYPSEADVSKYNVPAEDFDDKELGRVYNRIHFSVMSWDFGEKILKPQFERFHPISFTEEKEYQKFLESIDAEFAQSIELLAEMINSKSVFENRTEQIKQYGSLKDIERHNDKLNGIETVIKMIKEAIPSLFPKRKDYIEEKVIPYLVAKMSLTNRHYNRQMFDATPAKRWIVQRAFALGYDIELHGYHDRREGRYTNSRPEVERIGKKYQWIAYHEILAKLTDNHLVSESYLSKDFRKYQGTWEFYIRDIDPVHTTKNPPERAEDELNILQTIKKWWEDELYVHWQKESKSWVEEIADLPSVKHVIEKQEPNGQKWVFLKKYAQWKEPKAIGADKYETYKKQIWYMVEGYIIRSKDKEKIIRFLRDKSFWGNWMPRNSDEFTSLFNREKYWSPAYKSEERNESWRNVSYKDMPTGLQVLPIISDAKAGSGSDLSGASFSYMIPCEEIFNGLGLDYSPEDSTLVDNNDDVVVQNIPSSGGAMIKKDKLLKYLQENELDVIWILQGEKMVFRSQGTDNHFSSPCGVFYLEDSQIKGELNYYPRDY